MSEPDARDPHDANVETRAVEEALAAERVLGQDLSPGVGDDTESLDRIVEADPDEVSPGPMPLVAATARRTAERFLARSVCAVGQRRLVLALETASVAWSLDPSSARIADHLATLHLTNGDCEEAEQWAGRALSIDPDTARAWTTIGAVRLRNGAHDAAIRACERAVELTPEDWRALIGLAEALDAGGRTAEAIDMVGRAIACAAHRPELHYLQAALYLRVDDVDAARRAFSEFLDRSRGDFPVLEGKARDWLDRHREAAA